MSDYIDLTVDGIELVVKSVETQKKVRIGHSCSVLELKSKVSRAFNVEYTRQRLLFQGKLLKDEKRLLDYENLGDGKVVHLVIRPLSVFTMPRRRTNERRELAYRADNVFSFISLDTTISITTENQSNSTLTTSTPRRYYSNSIRDSLYDDAERSLLPMPDSMEIKLSRALSYIRDIQSMLTTNRNYTRTLPPSRRLRLTSIRVIREARETLQQQGNESAQISYVLKELADTLERVVPLLSGTEYGFLRLSRIIQSLGLVYQFLGSALETTSSISSNNTTNSNNNDSMVNERKRKRNDDSDSSTSSSSNNDNSSNKSDGV